MQTVTTTIANGTSTETTLRARSFVGLLVERGLASVEQARELLRECEKRRQPMGEVLLKQRKLSLRQVRHVLERQAETPDMRFGEIAVAEGMIGCEEVRQALTAQRTGTPHPAELLAEQHGDDPEYLRSLIRVLAEVNKAVESDIYALSMRLRSSC